MPDTPDLSTVRAAADKAAVARDDLHFAVRFAHTRGASLREIAQAAGLSHETVRKLVA